MPLNESWICDDEKMIGRAVNVGDGRRLFVEFVERDDVHLGIVDGLAHMLDDACDRIARVQAEIDRRARFGRQDIVLHAALDDGRRDGRVQTRLAFRIERNETIDDRPGQPQIGEQQALRKRHIGRDDRKFLALHIVQPRCKGMADDFEHGIGEAHDCHVARRP